MDMEYDPNFRHLPVLELQGIQEMDEEADRVRAELGWQLAAFTAVFDADFQWVLLTQLGDYTRKTYGANCWSLPGGAVEDVEMPSSGALRELKEETGCALQPGDLRPAGWLARPYFKSHRREHVGELLLLYAAIGWPDNPSIRAAPPETLEASFFPFDLDEYREIPTYGEGVHPLQPMGAHWPWWIRCAQMALEDQLAEPVVWTYESKEMMALPPWPELPQRTQTPEKSRHLS